MSFHPKVAIITNIIAPYRVPLFNALSSELDGNLKVFFCARTHSDREWSTPEDIRFEYEVLSGMALRRRGQGYYETRHLYIVPMLFPKLVRTRPQAVISAEFSLPSLIAFAYCKLFGAKFISWSENTLLQERYASRIQRWVRGFLIRRSSACIGTSSGAREKYIHYGCPPEAAFIGIQTVDVAYFEARVSRMRRERPDGGGNDLPSILYTGSLSNRKGVKYLLEAFALIADRLPCRLVLVGNGPLERELRDRAIDLGLQDQVEFVGFLEGDELIRRYAEASLFVLPTLEDTFGVVVSEAMACGLPVICSPFAGAARDLVIDGYNGYVVDPQQHEILAQRILVIVNNPELRRRMGEASRRIIVGCNIRAAVRGFKMAIDYALGEGGASGCSA